MSILSTAQALQLAVSSVEQRSDLPPKTKAQAIKLLQSLEQADWHRSWTKESILEALNDYKQRTGKAPTVTSLKEHGMPKSVTVQAVFQMSPSLLLKRLFPENQKQRHVNPTLSNPFGFETAEDWLNCFREQFDKHKTEGISSRRYNALRDPNTPTWETIARHCKISTWTELIETAEVKYIKHQRAAAAPVRITGCKSPYLEKLEQINAEHDRLIQQLIEFTDERERKERQWALEHRQWIKMV